jgi:hypothetical protein
LSEILHVNGRDGVMVCQCEPNFIPVSYCHYETFSREGWHIVLCVEINENESHHDFIGCNLKLINTTKIYTNWIKAKTT